MTESCNHCSGTTFSLFSVKSLFVPTRTVPSLLPSGLLLPAWRILTTPHFYHSTVNSSFNHPHSRQWYFIKKQQISNEVYQRVNNSRLNDSGLMWFICLLFLITMSLIIIAVLLQCILHSILCVLLLLCQPSFSYIAITVFEKSHLMFSLHIFMRNYEPDEHCISPSITKWF